MAHRRYRSRNSPVGRHGVGRVVTPSSWGAPATKQVCVSHATSGFIEPPPKLLGAPIRPSFSTTNAGAGAAPPVALPATTQTSCAGQEIDPPFVMAVIICALPATPSVIGSAA